MYILRNHTWHIIKNTSWKGGGSESESYNWSKQMFNTSLSGTFVNILFMSNGTIKLFGWKRFDLLSVSTKLKELGTVWIDYLSNTEIKKINKFDCGYLVIDKMGLSGIHFLCVFWSPYSIQLRALWANRFGWFLHFFWY